MQSSFTNSWVISSLLKINLQVLVEIRKNWEIKVDAVIKPVFYDNYSKILCVCAEKIQFNPSP